MNQQFDIDNEVFEEEDILITLIKSVRELVGIPLSSWAVAATIESLGIRDIDAVTDYGYQNVFELADYVFKEIQIEIQEEDRSKTYDSFKHGPIKSIKQFFKYYSAGLVLSLPMLIQIAAIIIFEYALWAWLRFNEAQATVIALGTIISFVITGGFIQVIGRLVSKYKGEENYYLARKAVYSVLRLGLPVVFIVGIGFLVLNLIFPFFPMEMMILAVTYMVLISLLLLSAAILFASQLRFMILFSITVGTIVVIILSDTRTFGVYMAQWIGISISTVLMAGYSYLYYHFKIQSLKQELLKQTLPNEEVSYYNNYRFFLYGLCYFAFLFTDRVLAWSTGETPPPFIIWFNTPYELGMDWALISLVITIASLVYSIHTFSQYLIPAQKNIPIKDFKKFNIYFRRFYFRQILTLLIISVISILITYYGVLSLRVFENQVPEIRDFFANPMTFKVFWMGSIGYVFLIFGLLNSLFFFTLNRAPFVTYSMFAAMLINFIVGYICSRLFGLEYATLGLVAGSFAFALFTGLIALRFFKHLDYYYYSAY